MKDRIPQYPGRVKLVPVAGIADTYDMTRDDDPIEPGTPLNKSTLLQDDTSIWVWTNAVTPSNPTVNDAILQMAKNIATDAKIEQGSYVGTGNYGASYPNTLEFSFAPKIVFLYNESVPLITENNRATGDFVIFLNPMSGIGIRGVQMDAALSISWDGNSVEWYATSAGTGSLALPQYNVSGRTYYYMAIGSWRDI